MPTDRAAAHAQLLNTAILAIVREFGVDSVHLVAHSKGGLDARGYRAAYQRVHDNAADNPFDVLSLTTLSTPHNGSVLADLQRARAEAIQQRADVDYSDFPGFTGLASSIAGNADENGNGMMNLMYQILRNTRAVTIRWRYAWYQTDPVRVAVLEAEPEPFPILPNDLLVTLDSAQGRDSIKPMVANTFFFTGPYGRDHGTVGGTGPAVKTSEWLVAIERSSGDLQ